MGIQLTMEINLQYQPQVLKYYVHVGNEGLNQALHAEQDIFFPFLDASKLEGERRTGMHSKSKLHRGGPAPSQVSYGECGLHVGCTNYEIVGDTSL